MFGEIGKDMAEGLGVGFASSFRGIQTEIAASIQRMNVSPTLAMATAGITPSLPSPASGGGIEAAQITVVRRDFTFNGALSEMEREAIMGQMQQISRAGVTEAMRVIQSGRRQRW